MKKWCFTLNSITVENVSQFGRGDFGSIRVVAWNASVVLAIQNVYRCIAEIKKAKNVSANNCGNDGYYAEIRKAPVVAYKPTEEEDGYNLSASYLMNCSA